jgi:hypothetical protein
VCLVAKFHFSDTTKRSYSSLREYYRTTRAPESSGLPAQNLGDPSGVSRKLISLISSELGSSLATWVYEMIREGLRRSNKFTLFPLTVSTPLPPYRYLALTIAFFSPLCFNNIAPLFVRKSHIRAVPSLLADRIQPSELATSPAEGWISSIELTAAECPSILSLNIYSVDSTMNFNY